MKISVITPSVRPELLPIVGRCLARQTMKEYEWLVGSPANLQIPIDRAIGHDFDYTFIAEPARNEGDFYSLNKCWNSLIRESKGKLIVSIVDGLWFPPDTLEKLWYHYEKDNKSCVTTIGHQYDQEINGKPEHMMWRDPRARLDQGSFYEVSPREMELCIASIPMEGIREVGGFDEEYDKGCAVSEKELCFRLDSLGYKFYIDQTIEYRAIHHPRLGGNEKWDAGYEIACDLYAKHLKEIQAGTRQKLDYL